ncbi:MAG: flagellar basal body rod C-terminal domain-containing protein, partial [Oscillospiraceae bacterium]
NTLTSDIAKHFNAANSTNGKVDPNTGEPIYDKPLFSANDGSGIVTAKNFSISDKWNNTTGSYITNSKVVTDTGIASPDANDNILYMASIFQKSYDFSTPASTPLFKGTLQGFLDQTTSTLALEIKNVERQRESFGGVLLDIDNQRQSVSSVNINEEGINLIQYNQSLVASSRFMTTLDEALDTIINKMGVVGR